MNNDILNRLHKIAMLFEDNGNEDLANELHDVFLKLSAKKKKKKKSGKNVPNDPALYARCKSEVKSKFEVWPSAYGSMALTKLYKSRGGTYSSK
jgi:hypothetical protein